MKFLLVLPALFIVLNTAYSQRFLSSGIKVPVVPRSEVTVNFDQPLREWDGFGVNYVEACQTRDYNLFQQDYSGFSFATDETRQKILDLIFNEDGWKPALTKLFLDPFHEGKTVSDNDNNDPMNLEMEKFDHETTTHWMRYFNREGQKRMKQWNGQLKGIITLYSPAPWQTKQNYVLGRDIDPDQKYEVAEYMVSWARFLQEKENLDIRYISFHNEGDAYYRWPADGSNAGEDHRDYNSYWPPQQVVEFLKITKEVIDANKLNVGLTPGETQNWSRFDMWGYAAAIANDREALANLDLITSHSFAYLDEPTSVYYGDYRSTGQDLLREKKNNLKAWVTSRPWSDNHQFIENIRRDIYESKVNGLIPWAPIAGAGQWLESDGKYRNGSMPCAFNIFKDGSFEVTKGYYYYKQVCRAGQPGMAVAQVKNLDPSLGVIAFSSNKSGSPDAFVLNNKSDKPKVVKIVITGSKSSTFKAYRTSDDLDNYKLTDDFTFDNESVIVYQSPPHSVTTFFGSR